MIYYLNMITISLESRFMYLCICVDVAIELEMRFQEKKEAKLGVNSLFVANRGMQYYFILV